MLVRLDAIGDFVLWSYTAKEYRNLFPEEKLTLVINSACLDLAKNLPYWDEVWSINLSSFTKKPFYRWRMINRISKSGFSVAIQPTYSRVFLEGDSLIRATGACERIGSTGSLNNISSKEKNISDRWYTRLIPAATAAITEIERNNEFLSNMIGKPVIINYQLPVLKELPEHFGLLAEYFIVFPGAGWKGRRWPIDRFAKVIELLYNKLGWQPVICGSADERNICDELSQLSEVPCLNLAGITSLSDFVEIARHAQLLISNETSAVHIAAAVGIQSVCITGGGHFGRFVPYPQNSVKKNPLIAVQKMPCFNCNWVCTQTYDKNESVPCINSISIDSVINLLNSRIEIAQLNIVDQCQD